MAAQTLSQLELRAFQDILIAGILIVFWFGIWGLLEEAAQAAERRYGCSKASVYGATVIVALSLVALYPQALAKF